MKKRKYFKKELGRREFFKKAFAAGAGAALVPSVLASEEKEEIKEAIKPLKPTIPPVKPMRHGGISVLRKYHTPDGYWIDIAHVHEFSLALPEPIDVTTWEDASDGYREFIPGRGPSKLMIGVALTESTCKIIKNDFYDDNAQLYELILPDKTSMEFKGYITEMPLTFSKHNIITCDMTIEITGAITTKTYP